MCLFQHDGDSGLVTGDVNLDPSRDVVFSWFLYYRVTLFTFPYSVHRNQVTNSSPHSGEVC